MRVVVRDGLIESINPERLPADARVLELGDCTLMPGLLDMHTHLTLDFFTGSDWVTAPVFQSATDWAIMGVRFAEQTLQAGFTTVRDVGAFPGFPAKNDFLKPLVVLSLHKAYKAGVKMALGTDACIFPHGQNGREFAALVANGVSEHHALKMATVYAADLLGVDDRGVIAVGKRADLLAVPGNPLPGQRAPSTLTVS